MFSDQELLASEGPLLLYIVIFLFCAHKRGVRFVFLGPIHAQEKEHSGHLAVKFIDELLDLLLF